MTPLVGLVAAKSFTGFETEDQSVKVLVAELPADAYGEVMNAFKANPAGAAGVKPESIETSAGTAYYTAETAKNARRRAPLFDDPVGRHLLRLCRRSGSRERHARSTPTTRFGRCWPPPSIRKEVPVDEQLALMPFKVTDLGDFKNVRALAAARRLLLADGDETAGFELAPFMVIGLMRSTPTQPDDRARFAQQAASAIPGSTRSADHDVRAGPDRRHARV